MSQDQNTNSLPSMAVKGGRLYQRKVNGNYYFETLEPSGSRKRRSTGTNVLAAAIQQVERYVKHGFPDCQTEIKPGLRELHLILDEELEQGILDNKTVRTYKEKLNLLEEFLHGEAHSLILVDIKQHHIEAYVKWRSKKPTGRNGRNRAQNQRLPSQRTIMNDLDHLRSVFKRAEKRGWIDREPTSNVKRDKKASKPKVHYLRLADVQALFKQAKIISEKVTDYRGAPCFAPLLEVVLACGLRREEALMLCKNDVDLDSNSLWIRSKTIEVQTLLHFNRNRWLRVEFKLLINEVAKNVRLPKGVGIDELKQAVWHDSHGVLEIPRIFNFHTKANNGERQIPIPENRIDFFKGIKQRSLADWYGDRAEICFRNTIGFNDSPFLFPDADGGPTRMKVNYLLDKAANQAGLPCPRLHDLRHTYATWLRQSGVELTTIQRLLGHEDIKSTLMYADFTLEEGRDAVKNLKW